MVFLKIYLETFQLFVILTFRKSKKILHHVSETIFSQIISWNFCKIGLNPEELELLECALVINFLKQIR